MTFYSYLKAARERNKITQNDLANKIGVSTTTIQNWETKQLPDKYHWKAIIEALNLDKEEFSKKYMEEAMPKDENEEQTHSSFPDFLFPDDQIKQIKKLRLTADEQEFFGLKELYSVNRQMKGDYDFEITEAGDLPILPYEFVQRVGAWQVINLNKSLSNKLGFFEGYVISQIKKNPDQLFDILKCSPKQYYQLCEYIGLNPYYFIENLKKIEKEGGSLVVAEKDGYSWKRLEEYSHFLIYHYDSSSIKDCDSIRNEYNEYITIIKKESNTPEYIAAKEKYKKDKAFFDEHSSMLDHEPEPPRCKRTKNVELTEKGKKLLAWYKENFK